MNPSHSRAHQDARRSLIARLWSRTGTLAARVLSPLARDERGGTAIFLAIAIIPLMTLIGLAVDTTRGYLVKSRLSSAVDAAALAGGRVFTSVNRDADVQMYFAANFPPGFMGAVMTDPITITPNNTTKKLVVSAEATIPTSFMHLVGIDAIPVSASAEVIIESQNVEVSLVLDITGSMAADMPALRSAANQLVDIVVQDDQSLFYTKVALAPYSQAVNVGSYASHMRGAETPGKTVGGISRQSSAIVTVLNHGFAENTKVVIRNATGTNTNSSGFSKANNVFSNDATGNPNGSPNRVPNLWVVKSPTTDTFTLHRCTNTSCSNTTAVDTSAWSGTYNADSATIYCATAGCKYFAYRNSSANEWKVNELTNCVTERVGSNVATDAAPSTTTVGRNYVQPGTSCVANEILPLTSDKTTLHSRINALDDGGSTAGHIGIGWGWYLLSPTFTSAIPDWPTLGQPTAYKTPNLMKVAILMTDGEFNTAYNSGVLSQDSQGGSYRINQNATNGNPYTQALNLCAAMKTAGITIYTVGFGTTGLDPAVNNLLSTCAKNASHAYLAETGTDLEDAFEDIAMKISRLRLTK